MSDLLEVRADNDTVGTLRADESDRFSFAYSPTWLTNERRFAVSVTLPLGPGEVTGGAAHTFFSNLLPEGAVRQAVCARLGISQDNDMALLRAIGGECAGAISLVDPAQRRRSRDDDAYEVLDAKRLQGLVAADAIPLLVGGATTRLSLAGAQDKVPVALIDGVLHLPLNAAPSTHILKLPNRRYPHLPANEAFALGLASRIGFDVVEAALFTRTKPHSLLVTRYDRWPNDGAIQRLHQEDLCQVLGLPPIRKYEAEGGPSFAVTAKAIGVTVARPLVDVSRVIRWQAYNVVIGNSDGHAKNLSVVHDGADGPRLSPFYDLVSTREYANLDRKLAMGVGGRQNPDEIGLAEWRQASRDIGVGERVMLELVRGVAQRTLDELTSFTKDFGAEHGELPILHTLPAATRKRARRVLRTLA